MSNVAGSTERKKVEKKDKSNETKKTLQTKAKKNSSTTEKSK